MKSTIVFLVCLMSLGWASAQEMNCVEKQKEFSDVVAKQNYKQANELLSVLRKKCPAQSEDMYLAGILTLQYNVDMASESNKEAAVRDLLKFYDQYDINFPNNKNGNTVNKAMALYNSKTGDNKEIYALLNRAFTANKNQFTDSNALYTYFMMYVDAYKNKTQTITFDQLMDKYAEVVSVIESNKATFPKKMSEYQNLERANSSLVKELMTPENVIATAEKGFEANSKNAAWLLNTANLLSEKAPTAPIFGKVATQLHQIQPSSRSAYHLANYSLKNRNTKQAIEYFAQSASLATDASEKAKTYYTAALIVAGSDKGQAKKFITSAIENDATSGSYYLFLATLYTNSVDECGATSLDKKAIYQLANQTAQKAAKAEPRLKPTAEQFANQYTKNSPTKQELDQLNKMGGKVTIGCWINETVQF